MPSPPLSKSAAWIVPGTVPAEPRYGVNACALDNVLKSVSMTMVAVLITARGNGLRRMTPPSATGNLRVRHREARHERHGTPAEPKVYVWFWELPTRV